MKPLRLIPANDTFRALQSVIDMIEGKVALHVTAPETNGLMPEVHGLPDEVSDDVALIVESSGSAGKPKRVELSAAALIASANASAQHLGGQGQWLLALPINFIAGMNVLIRSVLADTQPVMMNTQLPFTAEAFARAASLMTAPKRYTSLVPVQLNRLAAQAELDPQLFVLLKRFDAILLGGQLPDWNVVESLRSQGVNIVVSYGMTETSGGCIYDGVAIPGVDFKLDAGLISLSGRVLANGMGDWYQTSDLGEIVDGRLNVLGRADRVIVSGGMKISLEVIEQHALQIPGVEEAVAVAVISSWGESAAIVYTGSPEVNFDFTDTLGPAARIAKALRVDALPKLPSSKPDLLAISKLVYQ